ncbi:MAG: fluoride efflux transporter CrcB [bacterium]
MLDFFLVGSGAAFGGIARYAISKLMAKNIPILFPFGTLTVNVVGSFIIGLVIFYLADRNSISPEVKLLLTTGFCGGFTTFSTFSLETITLLQNSQGKLAIANIVLNVVLSLGAVLLALYCSKLMKG